MPTSTYHANTSGCTAWKGTETNRREEYDSLTPGEKDVISVDDTNGVEYDFGGLLAFHELILGGVEAAGDITQIDVEGVCNDGTGQVHYLKIWNHTTGAWETVDSDVSAPAWHELTGSIIVDFEDYVQAGVVHLKVVATNAGSTLGCRFLEVVVTYTAAEVGDPSVGQGIFINAN